MNGLWNDRGGASVVMVLVVVVVVLTCLAGTVELEQG
jgi:Flp pilus assembly protein TadG